MHRFIKRSLPQISAAGRIQYSEGNRNLWNTLWEAGMDCFMSSLYRILSVELGFL